MLFGEYGECDTFKRLSGLKSKIDSLRDTPVDLDSMNEESEAADQIGDLLKACRFCHIKNCEFFNRRKEEVARLRHVSKEELYRMHREGIRDYFAERR